MAIRSTPENYFQLPVHRIEEPPAHKLEAAPIHYHYYYPVQSQYPMQMQTMQINTPLIIIGIAALVIFGGMIIMALKK